MIGFIIAIIYAALMIFAIVKSKQKNISSLFIGGGCILILAYCLSGMIWKTTYIIILIIGMAGISAGAFLNGVKQNNVHITHHIIRLIVEAAITAICWIGI